MLRRAMAALLLLNLFSSSIPCAPARAGVRSIFLEGCDLSLELEDQLVPVEIQADSFLGSYSKDRIFVALVCRPNPRRTFDPGDGRLQEQSLRIKRGNQTSTESFFTATSKSNDVPFPGIQSWSLRWATRSHLFHLMVCADPRAPRSRKQPNGAGGNDGAPERLQHIATHLLLHEGGESAILEATYRRRLWAAGGMLVLLLSGAGLIVFMRIQRRLKRSQQLSSGQ